MKPVLISLAAGSAFAMVQPAFAQDHSAHDGMTMPGMQMPPAQAKKKPAAKKPAAKKPAARKPAPRSPAATPAPPPASPVPQQPASDMDHSSMPGMDRASPAPTVAAPVVKNGDDHSGHDMAKMPGQSAPAMEMSGTGLPAGNAPAPRPPTDHYADRSFPPRDMERSRSEMMREQGGQTFQQILFNLAEYRAQSGRDGYRWEGEAWFGGDIHRLTVKTEGEGVVREGIESAEVQILYSRAIAPFFNFQVGLRHDFRPSPSRTYAAIGFEGLAPYMFKVDGAAFVSDKGDVLGRLGGYYDQRITQRLILQPRAEVNLSAQDVPELRLGAGVTDVEFGLRLRYEIRREFAPYIGISYEAKTGRTADFARADRKDPSSASLVAGIRIWF
ncbi:copper resistance protein B [Sphingomonas koreensis]|uniref:copper resistance protein B n=1 Tax=Sphingomonas koreensis TaxID=93064 RepID=UPI00082C3E44|nr:copper resistance protein B [Sphingomonas koreensis]PJI87229.1 copper resistance protein B [Sphingomonas koreensis]RSU59560.1 copper resistance protein B [Sphingomonas koreensis]RSU68713.1 copper resistance protein B [Sphingomonas koreensis]